ncbi:MAG: helix-turn-helix domain-containing protein [bacterium]
MPQMLLPLFPPGTVAINGLLSFEKREGQVYYFHAGLPVFSHAESDLRSFRMFTSQLAANGSCKQMDIVRAFGVSESSVKRHVKKYRKGGAGVFFERSKGRRPRVLTPQVMKRAQELLGEGRSRSETARELGIKIDTLSKAIRAGRLVEVKKKVKRGQRKADGA